MKDVCVFCKHTHTHNHTQTHTHTHTHSLALGCTVGVERGTHGDGRVGWVVLDALGGGAEVAHLGSQWAAHLRVMAQRIVILPVRYRRQPDAGLRKGRGGVARQGRGGVASSRKEQKRRDK